MKFIKINNQVVNVETISRVRYYEYLSGGERVPNLELWTLGGSDSICGDEAVRLFAYLCNLCEERFGADPAAPARSRQAGAER